MRRADFFRPVHFFFACAFFPTGKDFPAGGKTAGSVEYYNYDTLARRTRRGAHASPRREASAGRRFHAKRLKHPKACIIKLYAPIERLRSESEGNIMPDNILYGVYKKNALDPDELTMVELSKDRETARLAVIGRNSLNKDKNIKYVGMVVQLDPWRILGPFNEKEYKKK